MCLSGVRRRRSISARQRARCLSLPTWRLWARPFAMRAYPCQSMTTCAPSPSCSPACSTSCCAPHVPMSTFIRQCKLNPKIACLAGRLCTSLVAAPRSCSTEHSACPALLLCGVFHCCVLFWVVRRSLDDCPLGGLPLLLPLAVNETGGWKCSTTRTRWPTPTTLLQCPRRNFGLRSADTQSSSSTSTPRGAHGASGSHPRGRP